MSRKSKYSLEEKIKACTEYLSGTKSATDIARELDMGKRGCTTVRLWVKKYMEYGAEVFHIKTKNGSYSSELKKNIVEEYLSGKGSLRSLSIKHNIPATSTILTWIKQYNSHIELKDYDPKPEVYMKNTLKTTLEERIEIVNDCLNHDRDIKGTAAKYGCAYAQLYQWVRKYEANGEDSLIDKRGKCC